MGHEGGSEEGWRWRKLKKYPVSHLTRRNALNGNFESLCGIVSTQRNSPPDLVVGEFDQTIKCAKCLRQHTDGEVVGLFPGASPS